jgi:hypothetical protein
MFRNIRGTQVLIIFVFGAFLGFLCFFGFMRHLPVILAPTNVSQEPPYARSSMVFMDRDLAREGQVVTFTGPLFSSATTTIFLYNLSNGLEPEKYRGTYTEDASTATNSFSVREGYIEGTISSANNQLILLRFFDQISYQETAQATTTLSSDGKLRGELKEIEGTSRVFEMKKIPLLPGGIGLSIHHLKTSLQSSPFIDVCEFEATYPVTDDPEINQLIQKALSSSTTKDIEEEAEAYLADCKRRTTTDGIGFVHENNLRMSRSLETQITLNQNGILSFFLHGWDWAGGAHGAITDRSITIDLEQKRLVTLSDLVPTSRLRDFLAYQKQWTLETSFARLHDENSISPEQFAQMADFDVLRSFISSTEYLSREEQNHRYGGLQDFYLTPSRLVKYYNSYDLGPWMNTPRIEIAYQGQPLFSSSTLLQRLPAIQTNLRVEKEIGDAFKKRWSEVPGRFTTTTSQWQTFTSPKYGYQISYPPEFLTQIDPRELHQTQSSPDRPEALHDFSLYYPMPEGFPSSFLIQVSERSTWQKLQPHGYRPLVSQEQWDEERLFLRNAQIGDGCDFLNIKYVPEILGFSHACRVIQVNGITMLDRELPWSPSTMIGRTVTFYQGDKRFDINLPNGFYDFLPFSEVDRVKSGTILDIGERILKTMRFSN